MGALMVVSLPRRYSVRGEAALSPGLFGPSHPPPNGAEGHSGRFGDAARPVRAPRAPLPAATPASAGTDSRQPTTPPARNGDAQLQVRSAR